MSNEAARSHRTRHAHGESPESLGHKPVGRIAVTEMTRSDESAASEVLDSGARLDLYIIRRRGPSSLLLSVFGQIDHIDFRGDTN